MRTRDLPAQDPSVSLRHSQVHPQKRRAFIDRLNQLFQAMESPDQQKAIAEHRTTRVSYSGTFFHLSKATESDFADLMDKLEGEDDYAVRFSRETLQDQIYGAIAAHLDGRNVNEYVSTVIDKLDAWHPRTQVYVPLTGIHLELGVNFDFGRVRLEQMDSGRFATEIAEKVPSTIHVPQGPSVVYAVNVSQDFDETAVYATYTVEADNKKAASLVDDYVGPVADYLQFCLAKFNSQRFLCIVDYKGRYSRNKISTAITIDSATDKGTILSIDSQLSVRASISTASMLELRAAGIPELAPLFGASDLESKDEYERLTYRAIRVFADGERSHSPRQKILSYVTACELFFAQQSEITRAVVEGVAYILGRTYEERTIVIKAMKRMYDARSSATHEGLEPKNLALYRAQVLEVLYRIIYMRKLEPTKFRTKLDLAAYVDRQRFSGDVVP